MNTIPIEREEFIAFDLETTGLQPVFTRIVEFGAVRFRGDGTMLDTFQQLVDPRCAMSPGATAVNGITSILFALLGFSFSVLFGYGVHSGMFF